MLSVFYGADTFRSRAAFRAQTKTMEVVGTSVTLLRDEALTPAAFQVAVESQPLFGAASPLAVERLTAFTGDHALSIARTLKFLPKARVLVIWEDGVPNARGIVWQALRKAADTVKEFAPLSPTAAHVWVQERLSKISRTIEPAAVQALLALCGTNLWRLASELDKLVLAKHSGSITVTDVETCTSARAEADLFAAVRAIASGDRRASVRLLTEYRRSGEEPRRLLFLAVREFRNLLRVRDGLDRGERPTAWILAQELRIPKAVADTLLATARETTTPVVRALFERCVIAYYHMNTGRADAGEILESLALAKHDLLSPSA